MTNAPSKSAENAIEYQGREQERHHVVHVIARTPADIADNGVFCIEVAPRQPAPPVHPTPQVLQVRQAGLNDRYQDGRYTATSAPRTSVSRGARSLTRWDALAANPVPAARS